MWSSPASSPPPLPPTRWRWNAGTGACPRPDQIRRWRRDPHQCLYQVPSRRGGRRRRRAPALRRLVHHVLHLPDQPPILSVDDRHVSVTVSVPDSGRVSPEDVETARRLADAVAVYIAELETRMAAQDSAAKEVAA